MKLITAFGQTEKRPGNVTAIYLDKKGLKELESILRMGVQAIDKLRGQVVIMADDDCVVTCFHQR